jgi:hypothetical protein
MPAPYRDKHFLEMSDREREARRLAEMQRSGRDAVEGVYPEQFLIPAGAAALSKVKKVLTPNKTAPKVSMPPEKLHDPWKHVDNSRFDPIKDLREREVRAAAFRAKRAVEDAVNRSNKLSGATLVAREIDRQQDEQEYKRGGAVKSKAFRGDGVAQRGKTKGRFV